MNKQELLILDILANARQEEQRTELYGLEIVERSQGELGRGTVYVHLNTLEEKKYIASRPDKKPQSQIVRHLYRLTESGFRARTNFSAYEEENGLIPCLA